MPRCQSCGAMTNAQDAKHCGKCGASLSGAAVYKECKNLHQYQGDHCPHCPTPGAMAQAGPGRGPRGAPPTKVESGDHGKGRGGMPVYQGKTEVKPRKPPWRASRDSSRQCSAIVRQPSSSNQSTSPGLEYSIR